MPYPVLVSYFVLKLIFAVAALFFGYRIVRVVAVVGSFLVFGSLAYIAASHFFSLTGSALLITSVIFGVIFACIAGFLYKISIFGLGAYGGYTLAVAVLSALGYEISGAPIISILIGSAIICGIIARMLVRPAIITFLSYIGANILAAYGSYAILNYDSLQYIISLDSLAFTQSLAIFTQQYSMQIFIITLVLFCAGMIVQFKYTGKK